MAIFYPGPRPGCGNQVQLIDNEDGTYTYIDASGSPGVIIIDTTASSNPYDNTLVSPGLVATNVQDAIDELIQYIEYISLNAFETIITDSGSVTADGADVLVFNNGNAIQVSAGTSPKSITIDVIPSDINLEELGNVVIGTPFGDGYTLVYREGSPEGNWVAEPSTTTDEFVKASDTDTTTGHLDDKLEEGFGVDFTLLNPGGNEKIRIDVNVAELQLSLDDLIDVNTGTPEIGDILVYLGSPDIWTSYSPNDAGLVTEAFKTIITDDGNVVAQVYNDVLQIFGGNAVKTRSESLDILYVDVIPSEINLEELGNVVVGSPLGDGYTLVYRDGSPEGNWVAEPSTTTDEFVKASISDTTTGHLDDKLIQGHAVDLILTNIGGDEQLRIDVDASEINIEDLGNVVIDSPFGDGYTLVFRDDTGGGSWVAEPSTTTDEFVKATDTDTTTGHLDDKLVEGHAVDLELLNAGGDEQLRINVDATEINIEDLGNVVIDSPFGDGYTLVFRDDTGGGSWVAEPSTTTDEFVKASDTDITTGHLDEKIVEGNAVDLVLLNPGGDEQIRIDVDASEINIEDLGNVVIDSPFGDGYTLVFRDDSGGGSWIAEPSTTTDEFVKASDTDTTTGHLDEKIVEGHAVDFELLNPGGDEQIRIDVDASEINIEDLGNVVINSPYGDGYTLVFREDSFGGTWVAEPSTTTDEFVKASDTDTTTGHLDDKLIEGNAVDLTLLNPGGDEQFRIDVDASEINIEDLGNVTVNSPVTDGYTLVFRDDTGGGSWIAEPSTTTDEFVKASISDTTTGHLDDKLIQGNAIDLILINIGGDEQIRIDVDPSEINIEDLNNVTVNSPINDGYTLVFREDSFGGSWIAEPSTTTDEFVKASITDTTTGHLDDKLIQGNAIDLILTNIGGDEQLRIDVDASEINIEDLGNVTVNSPIVDGYTLVFRDDTSGGSWVAEPSTTTDEYVKVSDADTTTGHLDDKVVEGHAINLDILNPGGDEQIRIDVDASEINIEDLGNVVVGSPFGDGYTLVFRDDSGGGSWIAEPSTTTDEFVKASDTDTTTGHLDDKLVEGNAVDLTLLNPGGDEQFRIDVDASEINIEDLGNVVVGSPFGDGYTLVYRDGSPEGNWVAEPSTTTDEFVKVSATDTTTGHLDDKLTDGIHTVKQILNASGNEVLEIDVDPETIYIQQLGNVTGVGSPEIIPAFSVLAAQTSNQLTPVTADLGSPEQNQVLYFDTVSNTIKWAPESSNQAFEDMQEPTGHVNRYDSVMSFGVTGVREFTIQPTGSPGSYRYYIHGVPHDITEPKSLTIPDVAGLYIIYFDTDETLNHTSTFSESLLLDEAITAIIYWNDSPAAGTSNLIYYADERHGINMDGQTHLHLHVTLGCQYVSGFAISGANPDVGSPSDADVQIVVENGWIRDEDLSHFIRDINTSPATTYDLEQYLGTSAPFSGIAQIPILFREGTGGEWNIKAADDFPLIYSDGVVFTSGSGRAPYNEESGGTWSLTEVVNNGFFFVHYLATNDVNNPIVGIQGISSYNNLPAGRQAAADELGQLAGLPFAEFVPIATYIYQTRNSYTNTPMVRVRETTDGYEYIDWRKQTFSSTTGGGSASAHGNLSGLQNDDHPQYTTDAYNIITDGTNTESASGRDNTIVFEGTDGIDITVGQTAGSPSHDSVTISSDVISQLEMVIIDGQPMLVYEDTTRTSGSPPVPKQLSVAEQTLIWSENKLKEDDWLEIGNAVDATSGYIMEFDGTIVFASAHCSDTGADSQEIHLYIDGSDIGSIGTLLGGADTSFINTTLDVDYTKGDKIRLRSQNGTGTGTIQDTVVRLTIKWRK